MDNLTNTPRPMMNYVIKLLHQVIEDINNGTCDESQLTDALFKFNPELKGYFKEDDFVNYDEAGIILGLGWNRNKINSLCKTHNIKNVKISNKNIGFRKSDIERLKILLNELKIK